MAQTTPIAGNFQKLSRISERYNFRGENFRGLLALLRQRMPRPKFCGKKLLRFATKPRNSRKFSPSKVSHYTVFSASLS